jgi:glycosyltransferase involved in cell wall biosynthesis
LIEIHLVNNLKLLYITNGITGSGGLERVLSVKASLLALNFCYEIHIISLNQIDKKPFFEFSDKINFHSIEVSGNPIQYFFKYKNGIQNIVNKINPDVISVCDDALKGFFLPKIIKTKAKWIHESHASILLNNLGKGISFNKKSQHFLKQILGKNFNKIILLTESNRSEWNLNNIEIIPNSLSFETEKTSTLQNKKIIAVGSFSYNKGYDLLLEICTKIEKLFPDWELNVYGKGTFENLNEQAKKINLKNINFHDSVKNIEEKYLESSIFVLPSRSEGFGMVLIEAMSCGLPVISFDCPHGPKAIISDHEDGFLVENGNIDLFAEKLKLLAENPDLRKRLGNNGIKKSKKFQADEICEQWDELFKKLQ